MPIRRDCWRDRRSDRTAVIREIKGGRGYRIRRRDRRKVRMKE